ncbi:putative dUTPase [[Clostridium] sordellii]|uniref:deoxyuridine 5'-triphosphate nucleotidohydrolase n=1 Tax=Paraclostridium sordellii TaxID=1505 RepID=UPI0005DE9E6E|nr:deoxyuridine 5'-triphosphate nucleotidohydrolase [Paeniclostridium sordellii]CEQ01582.1 putative dUTPase [[Clostridium] sordellii] [Paeniclostridium sordellii]
MNTSKITINENNVGMDMAVIGGDSTSEISVRGGEMEFIFVPSKRRGFELVSKEQYKNTDAELPYEDLVLPKRSTALAAGYDIISTKSFTLRPGQSIIIPTGFKAYMQPGEMLALYPRSGVGFKYEIQLANTVGIGDGDYYNCESNEGHYMLKLVNRGSKFWTVKCGERIAQAIFMPILLADGDSFEEGKIRIGGFGSTNK